MSILLRLILDNPLFLDIRTNCNCWSPKIIKNYVSIQVRYQHQTSVLMDKFLTTDGACYNGFQEKVAHSVWEGKKEREHVIAVAWALTKKGILIVFIIKFKNMIFPLTDIYISHIFMRLLLLD